MPVIYGSNTTANLVSYQRPLDQKNLPKISQEELQASKTLQCDGLELSDSYKSRVETDRPKLEITVCQAVKYTGNIQTDMAISQALEDMPQEVKDATYGIIDRNFLISDLRGLEEDERKALISLGITQAKYIAQNYMSEQQANKYLAAMETVAKYALNGTTDQNGKITYDIPKGRPMGAPEDYVDYQELMKRISPETFEKYNTALKKFFHDGNTDWIEIMANFSKKAFANKSLIAHYLQEKKDKSKLIEDTELDLTFDGVSKGDYAAFYNELQAIRTTAELINESLFEENMNLFSHMLLKTKYYVPS